MRIRRCRTLNAVDVMLAVVGVGVASKEVLAVLAVAKGVQTAREEAVKKVELRRHPAISICSPCQSP